MVFASFSQDVSWHELDTLAARAGVSVEYLCSIVEAVTESVGFGVDDFKGASNIFHPLYNDNFEHVVRVLRDDDYELAIKEVAWDESQHPRDEDGRFASSGSAHASAGIPYGAVVQPMPHVLPTRQRSASEARDELIRQDKSLKTIRKRLQSKLKRAQDLLDQLNAQNPSDGTQRAALHDKIKQIAKQVKSHQELLTATEHKHGSQLRQLLYVIDPTPVNVQFGVRPEYENIVTPVTSEHQKEAALTGAEEMRRMVSAKVTVGDIFFEHEKHKEKRSRYWGYRRVLLTEDADTRVVVHEFGHCIERLNPHIKQKAIAFRNSRTQGESAIPLSQFNSDYGPLERTRKDQFIDPYVGKVYPADSDTEIVTMGMEYFYADPVKFAKEDPEHFDFIFNTLRGN